MKRICFLFLILLSICRISANAQTYNILDYGAIADTNHLSTIAINKAVEACYQNGGGRVMVPAGRFVSGTITLKNNVELYLESGSILYASTDTLHFPRQQQPAYRSQKDPGGWYALIYAEGARHIGIAGKGTIDGRGARQIARRGLPGGDLDGRPRNVLFISCQYITVEGITMLNSGIWNQHYLNCEDVMVDKINVYNHSNRNNDGIDIDGCRRVTLSNSIIDSDDDAIVLKSTGSAGCENIAITNCVISSYTNGIKCGTESTGGFKNISISNCTVQPSRSTDASVFNWGHDGITGISLEIVDGGVMDGITVSNIMIEGPECPIYIRLGNRARKHTATAPNPPLGTMRNVMLNGITAYHTGNYSSSITGVPGSKIENVTLSNIRLVNKGGVKSGDYTANTLQVVEDEKGYPQPTVWKNLPSSALFIRHVKNITVSNISLASEQPDIRPAIIGWDVDKLWLQHIAVDDREKVMIAVKEVKKLEVENNVQVTKL